MKIVLKSTHVPERFLHNLSTAAGQICKEHQLGGKAWKNDQDLTITDFIGNSDLELIFRNEPDLKGIVLRFDPHDAERVNQIIDWLIERYISLFGEITVERKS